jgi:hypothetical protein
MLGPVGPHHPGRAEGLEDRLTSRWGESGIDRCRGVSGVPDGLERIDETGSTREVECDEFWHCR